jgi:DNA processing protein
MDASGQDARLAWLALRDLGKRGTARWWRAACHLGGARQVFSARDHKLSAAGLYPPDLIAINRYRGWPELGTHVDACARAGISIVTIAGELYPPLLREIPDPPLVLYSLGTMTPLLRPCVSIVGTRRPTRYGLAIAAEIAGEAAKAGLTVVSGLALGIDTEAHLGAMRAGTSVAVMAGGLDAVYPPRNSRLFAEIIERCCAISEYAPGMPALARNFPVRNRIITGLSRLTVIVQASLRSGTMVSARLALEQGREVYAVPGNIDSHASEGPNRLIRDGAAPITVARDVLFEYRDVLGDAVAGVTSDVSAGRSELEALRGDEAVVARVLERDGVHVDTIVEESGFDGARVMELLTALELRGIAERLPGGSYALSGGSSRTTRPRR